MVRVQPPERPREIPDGQGPNDFTDEIYCGDVLSRRVTGIATSIAMLVGVTACGSDARKAVVSAGSSESSAPSAPTSTVASAPPQIVAQTTHGEVVLLDGEGRRLRTLAQRPPESFDDSEVTYSPQTNLVAYADGPVASACDRTITFVAIDGSSPPAIPGAMHPSLSPDGTQIAYQDCNRTNIVIMTLATRTTHAIRLSDDVAGLAGWTGDGQSIVLNNRIVPPRIGIIPTEATSTANSLTLLDGTYATPWQSGTLAAQELLGGHIDAVDIKPPHRVTPLLQLPNTGPGGASSIAFSLDSDASKTRLLWVDENHELWSWSTRAPTKLGSGYVTAAW
jgi:hypothetical protein